MRTFRWRRYDEKVFDRLTADARRACDIAGLDAASAGDQQIGPEHLLIAALVTLEHPSHPQAEALRHLGVSADSVRARFEQARPPRRDRRSATATHVAFSSEAQQALQRAWKRAGSMGADRLESVHIALELIQAGWGNQKFLSVPVERIESELVTSWRASRPEPPPPSEDQAEKPRGKEPALHQYTIDMIAEARSGRYQQLIGRDEEVAAVMDGLLRADKNVPVLVGPPGVGKSAIVEGLALRLAAQDVPPGLKDIRLRQLDVGRLVAGTKLRGEFEERLSAIIAAARQDRDLVLFVDEVHTLLGAGRAEGSMDAATLLKPPLARGDLRLIGATTDDEYRSRIMRDAAFERRLCVVKIPAPTISQTDRILEARAERYRRHHRVRIDDEVLPAVVRLAARYLPHRHLPDSALDLLDGVCATQARGGREGTDIDALQAQLDTVNAQLSSLEEVERLDASEFTTGMTLTAEAVRLRGAIDDCRARPLVDADGEGVHVDLDAVLHGLRHMTGIPVSSLNIDQRQAVDALVDEMNGAMIGQRDAQDELIRAVKRSFAGLADPRRPLGSFLFVGPTGVGKTHLARCLARATCGREDGLIRFDMAEYGERHSVSRLLGAPPGYVGHDRPGQLTEAVRRQPYAVLLFDEIEKAHPDVCRVLLSLMEEGEVTDAEGFSVNFRNTFVVLTSNLGAGRHAAGFAAQAHSVVDKALSEFFAPEFLGRIDRVITFDPLDEDALRRIMDLEIAKISERLPDRTRLVLAASARQRLLGMVADGGSGARGLRGLLDASVLDPLSDALLAHDGREITFQVRFGKYGFHIVRERTKP